MRSLRCTRVGWGLGNEEGRKKEAWEERGGTCDRLTPMREGECPEGRCAFAAVVKVR